MAEARSNPPVLGGYDDEFVDAVEDDCHCVICQLPLKEPVLTKCGHRFCTQCLKEHFERLERDGQPLHCLVDRDKLCRDKGDIFPDKATGRKIISFVIKCPSKGCQWTGELRSKDNHLASCPLQVVSCTNDNCDVRLPRKDLQGHVTSSYEWKVLHCSHCDVSHAACKTKVQRRKVNSHLQSGTNLHLHLACANLNDTRLQLNETQGQLNETQRQLNYTQIQLRNTQEKVNVLDSSSLIQISGVHTWKICEFEEHMKRAESGEKTLINSPPFFDHGYKFGLTLDLNIRFLGTKYVSVKFFLMKGEYDIVLSWPLPNKKITITLIDQQEDPRQRENVVRSFESHDQRYKDCFRRVENDGKQGFVHRALISHDDLKERRYIVDDTIFIQIQIDPA